MNWSEYCKQANKTWNPDNSDPLRYIRNKLVEEFAEILGEATKLEFHGKKPEYLFEFGDVMWYLAALNNEEINGYNLDPKLNPLECSDKAHPEESLDAINDLYRWNLKEPECEIPQYLMNYITGMIKYRGFTLTQVWEANIAKVRARHGESYNLEHYKGV